MTNETFERVMRDQLSYCESLLSVKNTEYKNDNDPDRFHNFRVAAELQGCTAKQALAGMMAKHSVSIYDMCQGGTYARDKWIEKITDNINYLVLLRGMIEEENHADL